MTARIARSPSRALVVAAVIALLAAACSGSGGTSGGGAGGDGDSSALPECPLAALDSATGPVEVVVWHAWQAKQNDALREVADEYNRSQSRVHVRIETQGATDEELLRKFVAAVPSRQLPALFVGNDTETQEMIDSGVVLPAQSCVDADDYDLSPFVSTVLDYFRVRGVLWPATANPSSALLFYNKDHFRRAGLDPDHPPGTLAELRAAAEKIKAAGITATPFVHEVASYKTEFWLTGAHAPIVDNDNGRAAPATAAALVGNEQTKALFDWFDGMNRDGLMLPIPVAEGQINQYLAMANQKASMMVESSGAATSVAAFLAGNLDTSTLGVGEVPTEGPGGLDPGAGAWPGIEAPGQTQMGGPAWYLTDTTAPEVQAGAWDFVKYLNSEPAQEKLLVEGSYLPFRTAAAETPAAQQFFASSLAGHWLKIANDQVRTIDPTFPGPLIGPYAETRDILRDALTNLLLKGATPDDAIDGAQQAIDDAIHRYQQGGF